MTGSCYACLMTDRFRKGTGRVRLYPDNDRTEKLYRDNKPVVDVRRYPRYTAPTKTYKQHKKKYYRWHFLRNDFLVDWGGLSEVLREEALADSERVCDELIAKYRASEDKEEEVTELK